MSLTNLIVKPLISEKSVANRGQRRQYTFLVSPQATKSQVKQTIQDQFGVKVDSVNTSVRKGKTRRRLRARGALSIAPVKKAIVTLAAGSQIDMLEVKE